MLTDEQKAFRSMWVMALRGGHYKQGCNYLRQSTDEGGHAFCCLGVACDLAVRLGAVTESSDARATTYRAAGDASSIRLPETVRHLLGVTTGDVSFCVSSESTIQSLTDLNDSGLTFNQIADLIESGVIDEGQP